jgi:hypothetical protein
MTGGFHNGYKFQNKLPLDLALLVQDPGSSFLQLDVYKFFKPLNQMVY